MEVYDGLLARAAREAPLPLTAPRRRPRPYLRRFERPPRLREMLQRSRGESSVETGPSTIRHSRHLLCFGSRDHARPARPFRSDSDPACRIAPRRSLEMATPPASASGQTRAYKGPNKDRAETCVTPE
jgi:hypothetical protein